MLKSMTGYGRAERLIGGRQITVEIRSVNHRFSDYNIKTPRAYGFLEEPVRVRIGEKIARGKIDVYIGVDFHGESDKVITINEDLARNYLEALRDIANRLGITDDITVSRLAAFGDIFKSEQKRPDEQELWCDVSVVLDEALDAFIAMREREGGRIEADIRARVEYMRALTEKIDARWPEIVSEYTDRLYAKMKELLAEREADDARILTEVGIFADKIAVNEETVRLKSHLEELCAILDRNKPAGRNLDFLIQEINRETNTVGSKISDIEITKYVVDLKNEIEKLREQIQNIE